MHIACLQLFITAEKINFCTKTVEGDSLAPLTQTLETVNPNFPIFLGIGEHGAHEASH